MLIDANIFLELLLKQEKSELCRSFLNKTVSGEVLAVVLTFTIDAVLLAMHRHALSVEKMHAFLQKFAQSKGIRLYAPSMRDRMGALMHMELYGLDYEDALTLQAALASGSKEIVSFDTDFDGVKEVRRVEPAEVLGEKRKEN